MKYLHLIRHAKSKDTESNVPDIDRELSDRGVREAPIMGKRLTESAVQFDLLYSSPAARARATAALLTDSMEASTEIRIENILYASGETAILEFLKTIDDAFQSVAIVSHNPDMTRLSNMLGNVQVDSLPTCSVYTISLATEHWAEIEDCARHTVSHDYPKRPG